MNLKLVILFTAALTFLGGCASTEPSANRGGPYVNPALIMLTADQAARRGINVSPRGTDEPPLAEGLQPLDASSVITSPGVKVYTLARAVDPADRSLMHEEHVVYRREIAPQWRLQAATGEKILVGPRVTDGRQELQPLLSKELSTVLADQRRATAANQEAIAALFQAVGALGRQQEALARRDGAGSANPGSCSPVTPAPAPSGMPGASDAIRPSDR